MLSRTPDNNGTSYDQPEHDGRTFSHMNYDPVQSGRDPTQVDDILKVSGRSILTITDFIAATAGGVHREDGVDLNNGCYRCAFVRGTVQAGKGGVAITNKGGNCLTLFRDIVILPPYGRFTDIEDGNHSDQSWKKTTLTLYDNVHRADGKPVRYAWGRADRATFTNTKVKIVWWYTIALHVYVYVKQIFYPSDKK